MKSSLPQKRPDGGARKAKRTAQLASSESEAKYRTLFETIDEGFCIIQMLFDPQGKPVDYLFLELNPSFVKHTGLRDALGKTMLELAPLHEAHWFETFGRIAMTGKPVRFQNRAEQLHRTYDGYAFRIGDPEARRVAILFTDITLREQAKQELESFCYSVSHDLRAPLRHVQGFVELLSRETEGQLSEKARRYLKTIAQAGRTMGVLIDDLLAFSRMSRSELHESALDLDRLTREVIGGLEPDTRGRRIEWKIGKLPRARGDAAMLRQVFANLLGNAVKYSRPRQVATIEVESPGLEGERVVVAVRDNGVGFDMKYAGKLFGVFQRLHGVNEFEGTGIGLANVHRIVTRHGGRVWADSKPGEGATFYFTLASAEPESPRVEPAG